MMSAAMNLTPVELVIERLHAMGRVVKQRGHQWDAQCPNEAGHKNGDRHPSMGVREGSNGAALLNCRAGCTVPAMLDALGLRWADLFPPKERDVGRIGPNGREAGRFSYYDADGELVYVVVKTVKTDGSKSFIAYHPNANGELVKGMGGAEKVLYNLPAVRAAVRDGRPILLVEGEKDAENAATPWHNACRGVVTTNPFGADGGNGSKMTNSMLEELRGADVTISADNDAPGRLHADTVKTRLGGIAKSVRVVIPGEGHKDISEHLGAGLTIDDLRPMGPETVAEPDDEGDWNLVDVVSIAAAMKAGEWEPVRPTVLEVRDSSPLFYPGRINSLFGESGGGKTWVALAAVAEQLRAGRRALFIDYEDTAAGIVERLLLLGLGLDEIGRFDYTNPSTAIGVGLEVIESRGREYGVVVVDSTGESMAAGGVDPNSDAETARWFVLIKHLCRLESEPAVVVLDHVPKSSDAPTSYAIGSQRKRAAITGASYRVDTLKEPAKGKDGKLKLTVAKDRAGNRARGAMACLVDLTSTEGSVSMDFHLSEAQEAEVRGERFRPTALMQRMSEWLEENPDSPKSVILKEVNGNAKALREGLAILIEEGWFVTTQGERNSILCTVARAFREASDPGFRPTNVHPVGHMSDLCPEVGLGHMSGMSSPLQEDVPRQDIGHSSTADIGGAPPELAWEDLF